MDGVIFVELLGFPLREVLCILGSVLGLINRGELDGNELLIIESSGEHFEHVTGQNLAIFSSLQYTLGLLLKSLQCLRLLSYHIKPKESSQQIPHTSGQKLPISFKLQFPLYRSVAKSPHTRYGRLDIWSLVSKQVGRSKYIVLKSVNANL